MTDSPFSNRLRRTLARLDAVPSPVRAWARSVAIGRTIHFVGTAGVRVESVEERTVEVSLANAKRVQNHIGTVHAAAVALVAETATGLAVGMNVHDGAAPVLKSMRVDYLRRSSGGLRAVAQLAPEDAERMRAEDRGEVVVPVTVTDDEGAEPVACEMTWAWTPRRR